ncbi:hypothetical protein LSH36_127g19017 [Paralvinella palmiformis]|uniref:RNA polymerase II-associated factor 1 homolog n=1 Tax=Paralvinella palmiformis TaxID=53620 RepID=A0AAD9NAA9_9ANNE|nr:hypothetical protein LSH36_127g19017 [Paralvinella palmiformis]
MAMSQRRHARLLAESDLVCRVKYNNALPDIPFDPKFITYPFETDRFVKYKSTSLERNYKYDLLTEHDLGVTIDLINPDTYGIDPNTLLEIEDEKLLEEDISTPADSKRSRHHNKNVSWLRKTEYISTEYNRFQQNAQKIEAKVGYNIKKYLKGENFYKDRESQVKAIEATFEEAKQPIQRHHSKPNVYALEVLPVYPDFELWKYPCAQVIFDTDPAPTGHPQQLQVEEMSQAIIKGMVDDSGDQFVAYFLPTEDTLQKRHRDMEHNTDYDETDEYEYMLAREYNWNVKNKLSKGYEETYFFVFKPEGVYYNELETRVRLSKRRKVGGGPPTKSRLVVKHRGLETQELSMQEARKLMLEPPVEEEEEETEEHKSGEESVASAEEAAVSEAEAEGRRSRSGSESEHGGSGSERSGSQSPASSVRSRSRSASESASGSGSESGSGSGSESEAEDEQKKDAVEIFGSESSSGED